MSEEANRHQLITQLCEAIQGLEPDEQSEYLKHHCSDESLQQSVLEMLAHYPSNSFTNRSASSDSEITRDYKCHLPVPPNYERLEELGPGGMGVVFLARQISVGSRKVALKYLTEAHARSRTAKELFADEIKSLALLKHNNIASIYEGGTIEETSFFSMEYVEGSTPLTRFCDDNKLSITARLKLFLQLCEAVEYAHARTIIHRDLKPANVLVNSEGIVKLIDFGLTSFRQSESKSFAGTIGYASPEQARREVSNDTRIDVFALGSILRELIVGANYLGKGGRLRNSKELEEFFDKQNAVADRHALLSEIDNESDTDLVDKRSTTPKQLRRFVCSDFGWILEQTLHEDVNSRPSVSDLAEDIRNLLHKRPVNARMIQLGGVGKKVYCTRKFFGRQRIVSLIAATGLLALVGWGYQLYRTNEESALRLIEANKATATQRILRKDAERSRDNAKSGFRTLATVFRDLDMRTPRQSHSEWTADFANNIADASEQLDASIFDSSIEYALLLDSFSSILIGLRNGENAIRLSQKSQALLAESPDASEADRIRAEYSLALAYLADHDFYRAVEILDDCLERMKEHFGPGHLDTLRCQTNLATALSFSGRAARAKGLLQDAIPGLTELQGELDGEVLIARGNLANCDLELGFVLKAREQYEILDPLMERNFGQEFFGTIVGRINYGKCLNKLGAYELARQTLQSVLPLASKHLGETNPLTMIATTSLAEALTESGNIEAAREFLQDHAFDLKLLPQNPTLAPMLMYWANCYAKIGEYDEAIKLGEAAYEQCLEAKGEEGCIAVKCNLAYLLRQAGELPRAVELLEECRGTSTEHLGSDAGLTIAISANLAEAFVEAKKTEEATAVYDELFANISIDSLGANHAIIVHNYVKFLIDQNRVKDAMEIARTSVQLLTDSLGKDSPVTQTALLQLAKAQLGMRDFEGAKATLDESIPNSPEELLRRGKNYTDAFNLLGGSFFHAKQYSEAVRVFELVVVLLRRPEAAPPSHLLITEANLASSYVSSKQPLKAVPILERLLESEFIQQRWVWPNTAQLRRLQLEAYLDSEDGRKARELVVEYLRPLRTRYEHDLERLVYVIGSIAARLTTAHGYEQASELLEEAIAITKRRQPGYWRQYYCMTLLGRNQYLAAVEKTSDTGAYDGELIEQAESNLTEGYESLKAMDLPFPEKSQHELFDRTIGYLLELLETTGDDEKTQRWQAERDSLADR
ncbi:MAG: hypothetical protein Aurels2KO_55790 [Aureliella sp.]